MYRKAIGILTVLLAVAAKAMAQYDVYFSHYFDMETSFNPAAVGKQDKLNIAAAYATDMTGFENNPRSMYAGADMPFVSGRVRQGAGLQFLNDKLGLYTHQRLAAQYAAGVKVFGGRLTLGLQVGLLSENFSGSKIDVEDAGDNALPTTDVNGTGIDAAIGLYYQHRGWYAGASVQHLNAPRVTMDGTYQLKIDPACYFTGGCNIQLRNPFLSIKPSVLLRSEGTTTRADVTGRLVYTNDRKLFYGGVSYSPTNSVTVLLGGRFHGVVLGYSYEIYTSGISPGNGSHELFAGYQMDIDLRGKGRNKHKSVRIL